MDEMLSVESSDEAVSYRIQRVDRGVVYVTVIGPGFLAEHDRNHGPTAVAKLRSLAEWKDCWTTLHVYMEEGAVQCEKDRSPPPAVPKEVLRDRYPLYDIASLSLVREYKSRTSEVSGDGRKYILKIARFPREIEWVTRELQAYHRLAACPLVPRLVGYVFETCQERVIGFLIEKAEGRFPELRDYEEVRQALDQLHRYLIHGDLVKYNIIMTHQGPIFIDLEASVLIGTKDWSDSAMDKEKQSLRDKLADDECGAGRPWE